MIDCLCTRRTAMAGMASTGLVSCAGMPSSTALATGLTSPSLDEIAQRSGRRFGTALA